MFFFNGLADAKVYKINEPNKYYSGRLNAIVISFICY